jgi:hypothetical protein
MDIVMSDGIYVNIGFLVVSLLALGLVYLASQRLQHRTARERSLVILLILALIPAYFIVSDWEDIAWELTMASKYEIRDADGNVVPNIIVPASIANYTAVYTITNVADEPFMIVDFRGGSPYSYYGGIISPSETYPIDIWIRESLDTETTITVRVNRIK